MRSQLADPFTFLEYCLLAFLISIAQVVKAFKGLSSRFLRQEFPELLKLPSLWTHSYMFDTTGKINIQKVLEYINDPDHG